MIKHRYYNRHPEEWERWKNRFKWKDIWKDIMSRVVYSPYIPASSVPSSNIQQPIQNFSYLDTPFDDKT